MLFDLVQSPSTLSLTVGGFQVVEVNSEQLAMLQPSPRPSVNTSAGTNDNLDTDAGERQDSKLQDDAVVRQMLRSTPDALGRVTLFVIDGGIRLPVSAQEERASPSSKDKRRIPKPS